MSMCLQPFRVDSKACLADVIHVHFKFIPVRDRMTRTRNTFGYTYACTCQMNRPLNGLLVHSLCQTECVLGQAMWSTE
eukprot:7485024-Pyramimonas_sp.AAC.1